MNFRFCIFFLLLGFSAAAGHLGYLYPGGARAGETVDVLAGGQNNWGTTGIWVDGDPGVECLKVDNTPSIPFVDNRQRQYLKDLIKAHRTGKPLPPLPENTEGWRKCPWFDKIPELTLLQTDLLMRALYIRPNPLQASPSLNQKTILRIRVAQNARPGIRFIRLQGRGKLSNPVPFIVSPAAEIREPAFTAPYEKRDLREFTLPGNLNGQILPGETDVFKVRLKAGTLCHFKVYGRFFKPFIGDGVPGFFQPVLEIFDAQGRSLFRADRNGLDPDPLLECRVPADGEYFLKIRDALYRGREDFVYRIHCGTGTYPRPEKKAELPPLPRKTWTNALEVTSPVLISGNLAPGERQKVRIRAEKKQQFVFETLARRTGSPLDTVLRLYGPDGTLAAECDDPACGVLSGREMHRADARIAYTAPKAGTYSLEISDSAGMAGKYLLRIDRPRPDFQLIASPSGIEAGIESDVPVTIHVIRREGFANAVKLAVEGSPLLRIRGNNVIPPGVERMIITVYSPWVKKIPAPAPVRITGTAETPDGPITRTAIPADPAMQAFAYTHLVDAPLLIFAANWRGRGILTEDPTGKKLCIPPGGKVELQFQIRGLPDRTEPDLPEIADAPKWLSAEKPELVTVNAKRRQYKMVLTLRAAPSAPPGAQFPMFLKLSYHHTFLDKNRKTRTGKGYIFTPVWMVHVEGISK